MDVHPPHHPIRNWSDFFLHLLTITIGLLIALGLEGLVEWNHHRELVARARETLRTEMESNRKQYAENLRSLDEDIAREGADLQLARELEGGAKGLDGQFHSSFTWSSLGGSAWQTARDTGALGYIPYGEVQRLDELYLQQALVNQAAVEVFTLQTRAAAPVTEESTLDKLSPGERAALLRQTSETILELKTLRQMLLALGGEYQEVLGRHPEGS